MAYYETFNGRTAYVKFVHPPPDDPGGPWEELEGPEHDYDVALLIEAGVPHQRWNSATPAARRRALNRLHLCTKLQDAVRDSFNSDERAARADEYLAAIERAEPSVRRRTGYPWTRDNDFFMQLAKRVLPEVVQLVDQAAAAPERRLPPAAQARRRWVEARADVVNACLRKNLFVVGQGKECKPADFVALANGRPPGRIAAKIVGRAFGVSSDALLRK